MKLRINIHSFIDVITNSSTEIFTVVTKKSVEYAKDLIDAILLETGSGKTCDDLFDVTLQLDSYYVEDLENNIRKDLENKGIEVTKRILESAKASALRCEFEYEHCLPKDHGEGSGIYFLEITSKESGKELHLENLVSNIFITEERYC